MRASPTRVLLVEDNPGDALVIENMLQDIGDRRFPLERASHLAEALEHLDRGKVDVVLLDLLLPDSAGVETLERVRERAPAVPVVVVTGFDDEDLALRAVRQGAQDFLVKGGVWGELLIRSITYAIERHHIEEELRQAKEAAADADCAKSELVALVSHEIRSPLNTIMGFAELLSENGLTPEQRHYVELIAKAGRDLLDVANDLLDLFQAEARPRAIETIDFDLGETLDEIAQSFREQAKRKGLDLTVCRGDDVPCQLRGDPRHLRRVLGNLLGNAIEFTEAGGVSLEVTSDATMAEWTMLRFSVSDNGIAIPDEKRDALFEPFTQADPPIRSRFGGSGFGSSLAKRLVERMGGEIRVRSEPGRGSIFTFTASFETRTVLWDEVRDARHAE